MPAADQQAEASTSRLTTKDEIHALPSATDPRNLLTPLAVKRALQQLQSHSKQVDQALEDAIRSATSRIATSQGSIAALAPQIDLLREEAQVLQGRLVDAAKTSDRISGSVRTLDEERRRIRLASTWVQHTQDLKASLASLASAVEQGDWELATKHAQKAMAVPTEVVESEFCRRVVPSTEQPLPPDQTLENLRRQLLTVFTQRFHKATEALDQAEASRYFRLFPQLGFRAEGLEAYSSFARSVIRDKGKAILDATAKAGTAVHAQLLTALFEQLALLIDTHQPVVDRHYGAGNFVAGVMPGLQEECDRIGTRILESWGEKASVTRRLDEARSFTFYFLANLGSSQQHGKGNTPRSTISSSKFGIPGRVSTPLGSTRPGTPSATDEAQPPDGRDVDRLLSELAAMAARWATYKRFLRGRLCPGEDDDSAHDENSKPLDTDGEEDGQALKDFRRSSVDGTVQENGTASLVHAEVSAGKETVEAVAKILQESALTRSFDAMLEDVYCPLERWYLRRSLEKVSMKNFVRFLILLPSDTQPERHIAHLPQAHLIDTQDTASRPMSSSVLDDAFFLIRATLSRILSTSHVQTIATALRSLRTTADDDYIQVLLRRLESTWRNVGGALAGPDGPRKENAVREMRTQFILYLNVLSISASYADRILSDLSSDDHLAPLFSVPAELREVGEKLSSLTVLSSRLTSATRTEMEHLFNQVTRPRLRMLLNETFRDVSYILATDADFAEAEYNDVVRKRFVKGWDAIVVAPYRELFTEANFEAYFTLCVENFVRPLEKWIMTSTSANNDPSTIRWRFTELGALRFDKDWRSMAAHMGAQAASGEIRDKFARIQQSKWPYADSCYFSSQRLLTHDLPALSLPRSRLRPQLRRRQR